MLDVNVVGPLRVTQKLLPLLLKQNTRKVVNISSMLGSISATRWAACAVRSRCGEVPLSRVYVAPTNRVPFPHLWLCCSKHAHDV